MSKQPIGSDDDDLTTVNNFGAGLASGAKSLQSYDSLMKQILKAEGAKYKITGKMNRALTDALRYQNMMSLAQKKADLVTEHLKMRDALKKGTDSLSLFTGYLSSPVSPMTVFKKLTGKITDSEKIFFLIKTLDNVLNIGEVRITYLLIAQF